MTDTRTAIAEAVAKTAVDGLGQELRRRTRDRDSVEESDIEAIDELVERRVEETVNQRLQHCAVQEYGHDVVPDGSGLVAPETRETSLPGGITDD